MSEVLQIMVDEAFHQKMADSHMKEIAEPEIKRRLTEIMMKEYSLEFDRRFRNATKRYRKEWIKSWRRSWRKVGG